MDDIQELAQQLSRSPVAEDLHRIWRRASQQFQQELRRPARQRVRHRNNEYDGRRSNVDDELVAWAKNASVYLKTFKRMLDKM
ncbi:unnamed protein product [Colias eurytheme]|nr:unnamed protein product [Colias eurytheme]